MSESKSITRDDYMRGNCTHREYYAQFVTDRIRAAVVERFGEDLLRSAITQDEHLNKISLRKWDLLGHQCIGAETDSQMRRVGDCLSLSGKVCILKEAAKQVLEMQVK